jgi:hypothetical protein
MHMSKYGLRCVFLMHGTFFFFFLFRTTQLWRDEFFGRALACLLRTDFRDAVLKHAHTARVVDPGGLWGSRFVRFGCFQNE